jgi:serine/threonine protein kinase
MIDLLAKPRHVRWSSWVTSASTAARDLFSLGVTFQQLLSGRLPFDGNEPPADIRSFAEIPEGWYASLDVRSPRTPMSGTRPESISAASCASRLELRPRWT